METNLKQDNNKLKELIRIWMKACFDRALANQGREPGNWKSQKVSKPKPR